MDSIQQGGTCAACQAAEETFFGREQLVGKVAIVRYIVRSAQDSSLGGQGVLSTVQVTYLFLTLPKDADFLCAHHQSQKIER